MAIAKYKQKLLDEFENKDNWNYGDFERRLGEVKKGADSRDAKSIIIEAAGLGKWPNTVKRYLCTNYVSFGNVASEFNRIFEAIFKSLTEAEKKSFGINK